DVAPGHRRLSRPDHRNRLAHAHAIGEIGGDRGADLAPDRVAQPFRAQSLEFVKLWKRPDTGGHHVLVRSSERYQIRSSAGPFVAGLDQAALEHDAARLL